jgi:uncharacterized membrane protein
MVTQPAPRVGSVDLLRGAVMLLMVVDHVRFFLMNLPFSPTDAARTTLPLFATRWLTHFCAPVFMLLAGIGARLSLGRGRSCTSLSWFLASRGVWLVVLELTVARLAWQFNLDYSFSSALVLWALGWSMIALAGLVWAPPWASAVVGLAMIGLHDAFDRVPPEAFGRFSWLWTVLHVPGVIRLGEHARFEVLYPLVPWIGVMSVGYALGPTARTVRLGQWACVSFVVLRATGVYGDPHPWSAQEAPWRTVLSFLDTAKYPPSLCFLLMTLGPALMALPLAERARGPLADVLRTFGRVPLFFWLLHVPLIHAIAVVLSLAKYGRVVSWLVDNPPAEPPSDYGYGLGVVYLVTTLVIVALYPACRWFADVKARRRDAWLSYI